MMLLLVAAHAHLMPDQHGTLNFTERGVFFVASVPIRAFVGIDDDGDGKLSSAELAAHEPTLRAQVDAGLSLAGSDGEHGLEGLLLNPAAPHDDPSGPAEQLVIMGRFPPAPGARTLRFGLFGSSPREQRVELRATRGDEQQLLTFTPATPEQAVFAQSSGTFWMLGALTGLLGFVPALGWKLRSP